MERLASGDKSRRLLRVDLHEQFPCRRRSRLIGKAGEQFVQLRPGGVFFSNLHVELGQLQQAIGLFRCGWCGLRSGRGLARRGRRRGPTGRRRGGLCGIQKMDCLREPIGRKIRVTVSRLPQLQAAKCEKNHPEPFAQSRHAAPGGLRLAGRTGARGNAQQNGQEEDSTTTYCAVAQHDCFRESVYQSARKNRKKKAT